MSCHHTQSILLDTARKLLFQVGSVWFGLVWFGLNCDPLGIVRLPCIPRCRGPHEHANQPSCRVWLPCRFQAPLFLLRLQSGSASFCSFCWCIARLSRYAVIAFSVLSWTFARELVILSNQETYLCLIRFLPRNRFFSDTVAAPQQEKVGLTSVSAFVSAINCREFSHKNVQSHRTWSSLGGVVAVATCWWRRHRSG